LYSLTYISSGRALFSRQQLDQLAAQSSADNALLRITGMLLYKDGSFMQILEGEQENVINLYAKITLDPRHSGVVTMLQGEVLKREFPRWSMGFQYLDRLASSNLRDCAEDLLGVIETNRSLATPSQAVKLMAIFAGLKA
jgi:Sensors of blue-light using FAD